MSPISCRGLLGRAVRWRQVRIGAVEDLLLDLPGRRALGLEVLCGDGQRRFLALAAAGLAGDEVAIASPLVLVDAPAASFYRERATSLAALAGTAVRHDGGPPGSLADVLIDPGGEVESLVVRDARGSRTVPAAGAEIGPRAAGAA